MWGIAPVQRRPLQPATPVSYSVCRAALALRQPLTEPAARGRRVAHRQAALLAVAGGVFGSARRQRRRCGQVQGREVSARAAEQKGMLQQDLRAGDLGQMTGESFFPETEEQAVATTGEMLPSDPPMRIGHGYDIHKYLPRDAPDKWGATKPQPTTIGGVVFDQFELGVVANSDGDVIFHTVTDAILGALGLPDIGQFFPDNIPRWRGANSAEFFNEAVRLMELRKYRISNVDVTVICEKPRLAARKPAMKANVVRLAHTVPARVNIKARTHEKLDSVGELRGIECHACILLERSS